MIYIVRKRIKIAPEKALFIFVNGTMPATHASVDEIYEKHQDEDGFLYLTYCTENTFGNTNDFLPNRSIINARTKQMNGIK